MYIYVRIRIPLCESASQKGTIFFKAWKYTACPMDMGYNEHGTHILCPVIIAHIWVLYHFRDRQPSYVNVYSMLTHVSYFKRILPLIPYGGHVIPGLVPVRRTQGRVFKSLCFDRRSKRWSPLWLCQLAGLIEASDRVRCEQTI